MASLNSQKKIDAITSITTATILYLGNLQENANKIKSSTEVIAVPVIDKLGNGILGVIRNANNFSGEISTEMQNICQTWADRAGFGSTASAAFEDAKASSAKINSALFTVSDVEPSDGLHETVTDETVASFVQNIADLLDIRYQYIQQIVAAVSENNEEDTAGLYQQIGEGIELFANGIVDVLEASKDEVAKFGINLDDSIQTVQKQGSNIQASGAAAKQKLANLEGDLD